MTAARAKEILVRIKERAAGMLHTSPFAISAADAELKPARLTIYVGIIKMLKIDRKIFRMNDPFQQR